MEGNNINIDDFFRTLPYLSYLLAVDGKAVEVSYAWIDMTGYSQEYFIGKTVDEIFYLICREFAREMEPLQTFTEKNTFVFTKDHQVRAVNITLRTGIFPGEVYFLLNEKPGSRLEDKFPFLDQLLRSNTSGIAILGMPGSILLKANQCYMDYMDEPFNQAEYCIGSPVDEIISGWQGSPLEGLWVKVAQSPGVLSIKDFKYSGFKRGITYWDISFIPLKENGALRYIVQNIYETTDKIMTNKHIEEFAATATQERDEMESILKIREDFFSFISHEFKTPLTVINAAIQAMEHICADEMSEKIKKFIGQIRQNSLRLLRLISNLLDITRIENGYMKINKKNIDIVSTTRAITESVVIYARQKGLTLNFESSLTREIIALDDEKYERILLNLLSNAIKFTPAGKSIIVRIVSKHGIVCVEVRDEGIGIPAESQGKIFDRFSQVDSGLNRRMEGSGIGLCLTKLLVEALNGEIVVDSEVGAGSTFTVLFPAVADAGEVCEEVAVYDYDIKQVQAAAIEFSDVYPEQ